MLRKSQWSLAATALAVGAFLVTAARPAHAQARMHLTRPAKTTPGTGIVLPSSSSNTNSSSSSSTSSSSGKSTSSGIVVTPTTSITTSTPKSTPAPASTPTPVTNPAPQGFSAGPSLLGDNRINLSYMVNRVGPDIVGVGGPSVVKVHAHH